MLGGQRDLVCELGETLALDVADRDELLPDAAHVVDQAPALPPDRLGAAGQVAAARLRGLEHLLRLAASGRPQLVSLALGRGALLLALPRRRLAQLGGFGRRGLPELGRLTPCGLACLLGLAVRSIPCFLRLAQGGRAQLLGLLLGLLEPVVGPRARAGRDLLG